MSDIAPPRVHSPAPYNPDEGASCTITRTGASRLYVATIAISMLGLSGCCTLFCPRPPVVIDPRPPTHVPSVLPDRELENRAFTLPEEIRARVSSRLEGHLNDIVTAARDTDRKYLEATLSMLTFASEVPGYVLEIQHRDFVSTLKESGSDVVLPYLIEYGAQLLRTNTLKSRQRFAELQAVLRAEGDVTLIDHPVMIRKSSQDAFTTISRQEARIAKAMTFSTLGQVLSHERLWTTEDLFTAASLIATCDRRVREANQDRHRSRRKSIAELFLTEASRSECNLYLELVSELLNDGRGPTGMPALGDMIRELLATSPVTRLQECADASVSRSISRLNDYMACRTRAGSQGPNNGWSNTMMRSDGGYGTFGLKRDPKTGKLVGSFWEDLPDSEGGTTDLSHDNGTWSKEETGYDYDVAGNAYMETRTDASGNVTYESREFVGTTENGDYFATSSTTSHNPDTGTTTTTHSTTVDGASVTTTTRQTSSGTSTTTSVTVHYEDGSSTTWTTTEDEEGNVTETEETTPPDDEQPAMPAPDEEFDPCAGILHADATDRTMTVEKLETLIQPDPTAPPTGSLPGACMLPNNTAPAQCTSVWLCQEGQTVDENCRCVWPAGSEPTPPPFANACQAIRCSEGSCDPQTGACSDGQGGTISPGIGIGPVIHWNGAPIGGTLPTLTSMRLKGMLDVLEQVRRNGFPLE